MTGQDAPTTAAQAKLRHELLTSALYDWVPLIEIETIIKHYDLASTHAESQELALQAIRQVLEEGLMKIGGLPDPGKLPDWGLPIDAAMDRLHDLYIKHYDDKAGWEFTTWLGLTDRGRAIATTLEARRQG